MTTFHQVTSKSMSCYAMSLLTEEDFEEKKKKEKECTSRTEIRKAESLAVAGACRAIF